MDGEPLSRNKPLTPEARYAGRHGAPVAGNPSPPAHDERHAECQDERIWAALERSADEQATMLAPLAWNSKSQRLAQAALSWNSLPAGSDSSLGATGFIAAVLQRWGHREVADPHQACVYLLSLDPSHRAMAASYLSANPDMRGLIAAELIGGELAD